ncbi:hypothetical protein AYO20_07301 [Fonsecaea nubica]|uniref:F-box domain-containing protein n=1 Tax=Fonsecaea nubica TaxID=856822 RepID=A0A178CWY8_9EURO|nr:hypothetical protein AYO20_07301 [Fonsecaea nubica]OAL33445.1 hypothetical protein AYO20_07301 [Fonsecaea nubica]
MPDQPLISRHKARATLGSVPSEILQQIFYFSTTPTFFQLIHVNLRFFSLASQSREVILYHLRHVPGLKLGLENRSIPTSELFLIFRQRATSHLYGVNFTADCRSWDLPKHTLGTIDARASCLGVESEWGNNVCLVVKNSLRIRLNWHNELPGESIESPYADGSAKIIQAVQKSHYISVLYAWTPPKEDPANDTSHPEPTTVKASVKETLDSHTAKHRCTRSDRTASLRERNQSKASSSSSRAHYHLLHYDMFRSDRPVFFPIPTHKSINDNVLVPVHLAVNNRLQCAILWDLPDTLTPTSDATVCFYTADHLPRYEPGEYSVWVLYPYDRPSPIYPSRSGERVDLARETADDDTDSGGITYTVTSVREKFNRSSRHDSGQDLRLLHFPLRPRAIAFFKDGRRLSLYAPGSTVPFTTLLANEPVRTRVFSPIVSPVSYPPPGDAFKMLRRRVRRATHTAIDGNHFSLGLPFFSTHETTTFPPPTTADSDLVAPPDVECVSHILCVGTAKLPTVHIHRCGGLVTETGPQVLTIVQIRERVLYDLCSHSRFNDDLPALPRPPRQSRRRRHSNVVHVQPHDNPHPDVIMASDGNGVEEDHDDDDDDDNDNNDDTDNNSEADADEPGLDTDADDTDADTLHGTDLRVAARLWGWAPQRTTLTGLDTINISPRGERIAVAQWDRVLVYALDPRALCEEAWDEDSDSDDAVSTGTSSSESSSESEHEDTDSNVLNTGENVAVGDHNPNPQSDDNNHDDEPAEPPPATEEPIPASSAPTIPPKAPGSVASSTSTSLSLADLLSFYPHVKSRWPLERTIELRPLVLKMDGGAVVRKMCWSLGKPHRVDEEAASDVGDVYTTGQDAQGLANEMGGVEKEKEKGKENDNENVAMNNTASLTPQQEIAEGERSDNSGTSVAIGSFRPHDRPQPSGLPQYHDQSSPISDLQTPTCSEHTSTQIQEAMIAVSHEIPPAPFSQSKLIGQIKHIARPPDYPSITSTIVLEPPEPKAADSAEVDQAKGKEIEVTEASAGGRRDEPPQKTDQERGVSTAPELSHSGESEPRRRRSQRRRVAENELIVLTDRGLQVWDLSVWGRGRRVYCELPDDILH